MKGAYISLSHRNSCAINFIYFFAPFSVGLIGISLPKARSYLLADSTDEESKPLNKDRKYVYGIPDKDENKTIGRLIAKKLSKTTSWYNPSQKLNPVPKVIPGKAADGTELAEPPNLDAAWGFYPGGL